MLKAKKLPQSKTSHAKGKIVCYEFSSLLWLFGDEEEHDSLDDLATCMVICEIVLPSTSVDILMVYSVFSSSPSNRQLYLYIEDKAMPNSSSVISINTFTY